LADDCRLPPAGISRLGRLRPDAAHEFVDYDDSGYVYENSTVTQGPREALIKAGIPNFSFPWFGMGPLQWRMAADTSRLQAGCGPN
jgi:hypothetical protein